MRIVLADDHSLFRDGIASLLETAGYQVVAQANDGKEALEAVRKFQPDLVLLDIQMSGLSGLDVLELIKVDFPDIKVVMLTVSDADADLFAAIQGGADGYILKGSMRLSFWICSRAYNVVKRPSVVKRQHV